MTSSADRVPLDYAPPPPDPVRSLLRRLRPAGSSGYILMLLGGMFLLAAEAPALALFEWQTWLCFWGAVGTVYLVAAAVRLWRATRHRPVRRCIAAFCVGVVWVTTAIAWQRTPTHVWVVVKPVPHILVVRGYVGPMPSLQSMAGRPLDLRMGYWFKPEDFSAPLIR